jgi:2-keto-4-pentenoate hydratase/2-oxohepta-3-ene-1,7-dioic acid hydratase in catechol pathway
VEHYPPDTTAAIFWLKNRRKEDWRDVVFGFTIGNDVSARDVMFADGQWARAKGYDTFAPIGPFIETEIDPVGLEITTFVYGEPRRTGNTRDMIFDVPTLIAYFSRFMTLNPGDVILTGTPDGIVDCQPGDVIVTEIEGLGALINTITLATR